MVNLNRSEIDSDSDSKMDDNSGHKKFRDLRDREDWNNSWNFSELPDSASEVQFQDFR